MNKFNFFLLLVFVVLSCGENAPSVGGNEVPNMVKGKVVASGNYNIDRPVLLKKSGISSNGECVKAKYIDTVDNNGNFIFTNIESGKYIIYCPEKDSDGYSGIISDLDIGENTRIDTNVTLLKQVKIVGRVIVDNIDYKAVNVYAFGAGIKSHIDSDGTYFLTVPMGLQKLVFSYGDYVNILNIDILNNDSIVYLRDVKFKISDDIDYTFYRTSAGGLKNISPVRYDTNPEWYSGKDFNSVDYYYLNSLGIENKLPVESFTVLDSVLLDDFENSLGDSYNQNSIGAFIGQNYMTEINSGGGWWYGYTDVYKNGNSEILPIGINESFDNAANIENGNHFLHFTFNLKDGATYPFAGIGTVIASSDTSYQDFSTVSAISFRAKGEGRIMVKFYTNLYDSILLDNVYFGKEITLSSDWTKYKISVGELSTQLHSFARAKSLKWDDVKYHINKIHFETSPGYGAGSTVDMNLDDIYIYKLSLDKIIYRCLE